MTERTKRTISAPILRSLLILMVGIGFLIGVPHAFASTRTLRQGMKGADVIQLQADLVKLGYFQGAPSGFYGPKTVKSVKAFQTAAGIRPQSGIFGPLSRAKMDALVSARIVSLPQVTQQASNAQATSSSSVASSTVSQGSQQNQPMQSGSGVSSNQGAAPLIPLPISIDAPSDGQTLYVGSTYRISWTLSDQLVANQTASLVLKQYVNSAGVTIASIGTVKLSQGTYSWTVPPMDDGGKFKIEISTADGKAAQTTGGFVILNPDDPNASTAD